LGTEELKPARRLPYSVALAFRAASTASRTRHWCSWSLCNADDAPPNAAELLPLAEAHEAADKRAKEASAVDRAEADWQAAFEEAHDRRGHHRRSRQKARREHHRRRRGKRLPGSVTPIRLLRNATALLGVTTA
jgi:hypothetical protein